MLGPSSLRYTNKTTGTKHRSDQAHPHIVRLSFVTTVTGSNEIVLRPIISRISPQMRRNPLSRWNSPKITASDHVGTLPKVIQDTYVPIPSNFYWGRTEVGHNERPTRRYH